MRRKIHFEHLNDAVAEAKNLLSTGYVKTGNWTLGQICWHLRLSIEKNMHGYPLWMVVLGFPLRPLLRWLLLSKLLSGNSPSGVRTAGQFVPPHGLDDATEVAQLTDRVAAFLKSKSKMHAHPGFGHMSNEGFNHFHAAHAAHHLSFLIPENSEE